MGIIATRWEAQLEGHHIVVSRNELTKGFKLEWDGQEIARRTWSWIGLGELRATVELHGQPVEVHVILDATLKDLGSDGQCRLLVDGEPVPVVLAQ